MNALPTGFLVLPARGAHDVQTLRRKVRLIATRKLLTTAPPSLAAPLEHMLRQDPEPLLDAIGSPDVLPCLLAGDVGGAIPNLIASMPAASESLLWSGRIDRIAGVAIDPPARRIARIGTRVEIERESGAVEPVPAAQTTFAITPAVHLSITDSNPLQSLEDHPDKSGNTIDLGRRSIEEWIGGLRGAFELIRTALPEWYEELDVSLQRLIPVGYEPERHLSASYREAPGIAYLTLHPDPLTLAEAIIHETQHTKLNLLRWLDEVLVNGETCWTSSPVRPDLRPLIGVLMAVHAFVPVAALHQRLAELGHDIASTSRFSDRRAAVLASNSRGFAILDGQAQPTPAGRRVLDDLHALQAKLEAECGVTASGPQSGGDF